MTSKGQVVAFLSLAAVLAIGGCPGGGLSTGGLLAGEYIGVLACSAVGIMPDGSQVTMPGSQIGTSVEIIDADTFLMDDVGYYPGAVHNWIDNGYPTTETVTAVHFNDNNILVQATMDTFVQGVPASGDEVLTIQQAAANALDVTVNATFTVSDGVTMMMMFETCEGILTR